MRDRGNDEVIHMDYVKHGPVVRNLSDDDVIHVDLRKSCFNREKP